MTQPPQTKPPERPAESDKADSIEKGTDVDKIPSLDGTDPGTKSDTGRERAPERDEHGRL